MFIVMFVAGLLLVSVTLFVRWLSKPDRKLAAQEMEAFRRDADRAQAQGDSRKQALSNLYQVDAMADACGDEGFIPSWMYTLALIIGCLLMAPAIGSWLL